MKKKVVSLMLALTLAVPMTACGSQNSVNTTEQVQEEVKEEGQEEVQDTTQVRSSEIKIEGASYIELSDEEILLMVIVSLAIQKQKFM